MTRKEVGGFALAVAALGGACYLFVWAVSSAEQRSSAFLHSCAVRCVPGDVRSCERGQPVVCQQGARKWLAPPPEGK